MYWKKYFFQGCWLSFYYMTDNADLDKACERIVRKQGIVWMIVIRRGVSQ